MNTEEKLYYTYILKCADRTFYCGWTTDLIRRLKAHNGHIVGGAKYTSGRRPVKLVYFESFHSKQEATKREYAIKQMTKDEKKALIRRSK